MADISKVTLIDGSTYNLKDDNITENRIKPISTREYDDVIATSADNNGAGFFFLKVNWSNFDDIWYLKLRVTVTVPTNVNYRSTTISEIWATANTYCAYTNQNAIKSASYRPVYYISYFRPSAVGFNNGCGGWVGINLLNSANPTNASYKRHVLVELLDHRNCTVELQDELVTPTNIPNRAAHTNWYASTNTSYDNFDFASNGLCEVGDANTTTIYRLCHYYDYHIADSVIYRYQMLFSTSENAVTPLNNANNVTGTTKVMLTDVEFDPFREVFYYNTTTVINQGSLVNNSAPAFMYDAADLRYTFNITSGNATATVNKLAAHKHLYLQLAPQSNGMVKIASAAPLVQELPDSDDGYWYMLLGRMLDWYRLTLYITHPIYKYHNGGLVTIQPNMYSASYSGSGAGLTNLNASSISSGTLSTDRIPSLDASKITSGALSTDRIPSLDASKITSGMLGTDRLPSSGITAGTYGPRSNVSPSHGGTFSVPCVTYDAKGRATSASTKTVTLPTYQSATSSQNGLMSATDKSKLDNLTTIQMSSGINMTEGSDGLIFTYIS